MGKQVVREISEVILARGVCWAFTKLQKHKLNRVTENKKKYRQTIEHKQLNTELNTTQAIKYRIKFNTRVIITHANLWRQKTPC